MPPHRRAIVLSDIHLGPEGPLSTFRDSEALSRYLEGMAGPDALPTELVLAGDVFDFLQVQGYDGFSTDLAVARFESILRAPRTRAVIGALRTFAQGGRHDLTVLAGNHDPELLLPEVRRRFELEIGRVGSVRYADDTPLSPRFEESWPVWGHSVGNAHGAVWIVHGDRWDTANAIDREALMLAVRESRPVELPLGSRLVHEVISHLQPHHSWVVELKPELPAVLPLLLYISPQRTWAHLKKHYGLGWSILRGYIEGQLRMGPLFDSSQGTASGRGAPPPEGLVPELARLLAEGARQEHPSDPELLVAQMERWLERGPPPHPTDGMLGGAGGVGQALLAAWLTDLRNRDRFQELDGPDSTHEHAKPWLPGSLVALVAGHTHGSRLRRDLTPAYFNTGTWIPVGCIPQGSVEDVARALESGEWGAEAPRTLVRIEMGDGPPSVHLDRVDSAGRPRELTHARG